MKEYPQINGLIYGVRADFTEPEELRELYEVICGCDSADYHRIIEQKANSAFLYYLSSARTQLLEWIPVQEKEHILELGAQAGTMTEMFLSKNTLVDAIEPSRILACCNARRNEKRTGLSIFNGYLEDAVLEWDKLQKEKYDTVVLAGSLREASYLMGRTSSQEEVLQKIKEYLKPQGRLIVSIENRMGMKYWAGCKDESTGRYFSGIEGYEGNKTAGARSRKELKELLLGSGYEELQFYYPYPDMSFPTMIYSEHYLPKQGELRTNMRNYDTERFVLFDERKAYDMLLQEGLYPDYANAFLVIATKGRE